MVSFRTGVEDQTKRRKENEVVKASIRYQTGRGRRALIAFVALFPVALVYLEGNLLAESTTLSGWLQAQTNFQSWSASFIQTRSLKALKDPLVSTGHVWFAAPNRF